MKNARSEPFAMPLEIATTVLALLHVVVAPVVA
jgi:hypothetical protein